MNRHVIDRIRTNRRLIASRWSAQVAETAGSSSPWLDRARADRLLQAGIEALDDALVRGRPEPFAEYAARLSQEAFALEAPLHEVIRVILQLKPIVLEVLAEGKASPRPHVAAFELLDRLTSAAILEAIRRFEQQRQRRVMVTQERVEALRDRLRRHVIIDPATGLYNANHFPVAVRREVRRSRRFGRVFALALVCIDQDEEIREAWGEDALRGVSLQVAETLVRATRQVDVRAALGSGRFGLILPETTLEGAVVVAERIRRTVEAAPFVIPDQSHRVAHTVSIGLACFPHDAEDDAGLFVHIEETLAKARANQNRTVATASAPHA
jgi:diguanylate cyclase (GGDEF)-like protein